MPIVWEEDVRLFCKIFITVYMLAGMGGIIHFYNSRKSYFTFDIGRWFWVATGIWGIIILWGRL